MKPNPRSLLPIARACELEIEPPDEKWLIDALWGRTAVGLIGGAPKCCKTYFGLDLAVSVASGTEALGRFAVHLQGSVLIYLAEDALPQVRARLEALCRHRGVSLETLAMSVITAPSLRLDQPFDQARLAATLEHLRPSMLLLDPLVRLHRLNENDAGEISGLLGYFRELQRAYELAIAVVHHASKKHRAQPGQALRGSTDLHAFGDSNAYLSRKGNQIILTLEHRAAKPPPPIALELVTHSDGKEATHLAVCGDPPLATDATAAAPLEPRVVALLAQARAPLPRTAIRSQLRVNNQRLGQTLARLLERGELIRVADGWSVPKQRVEPAPSSTDTP